ncbi:MULTISPECIES: AAA family ATPase [Citrobacter]|nr:MULTISPECIES: ATP-binding cassette domain-containing protein [Citrobacter]MDM3017165.1 ATP-binding cassette domain-containing protein [Citrobacter sp. CK189]
MKSLQLNKTGVGNITVDIDNGDVVFLIGSNGSGKSSLVNHFHRQLPDNHVKIISAHRQNWFNDSVIDMTGSEIENINQNNRHYRTLVDSRWKLYQGESTNRMVVAKLKRHINRRAREIESAYDRNTLNDPEFKAPESPLVVINSLIEKSNMDISIHVDKDDNFIVKNRSYNDDVTYSIAELSDGEKNALLIAADVLTSSPGTLIIMDEPERHLHRAITLPLLSELVSLRSDCSFLISTHEILFPSFFINSKVILVRSCEYVSKDPSSWTLDILDGSDDIPEEIKESIFGSRRKVLFVEGDQNSLDLSIYSSLFHDFSVIPKGSCKDVEASVVGIASNRSLQWVEAYGLVDNDNKTQGEISSLLSRRVYTLDVHSVESIYYHPEVIRIVISAYADYLGIENKNEVFDSINEEIIKVMNSNKDRLCSRSIEKIVRSKVFSNIPTQAHINSNEDFHFHLNINEIRLAEVDIFDTAIQNNDVVTLMTRYPIRETGLLNTIAKKLGFPDRKRYELNVRNIIRTHSSAQSLLKSLLGGLYEAIYPM